jgi:hypothetical protein
VAARLRLCICAVAALFASACGAPHADRPAAAPSAPDGLLVLAVLSPERVLVADPRTGETRERELAGGTLCHGPVLAVADRVLLGGTRRGRPVMLSLPLDLSGPGRALGPADTFVPSSSRGRVWLGRWTPEGHRTASISFREVAPDGQATGRVLGGRHPRWSVIEAAVGDGFLVRDDDGLRLWPAGPRMPSGWLLAADGTRFAWCREDEDCRRPVVGSPAGMRSLDPPRGIRPDVRGQASFSPDGRRLALPVRTPLGVRVAVVELGDGRWQVLRGARLAGYRATAWSPSGRRLYFTGSRHRIVAWQGGRPEPLPIRTGGMVMSIATVAGAW